MNASGPGATPGIHWLWVVTQTGIWAVLFLAFAVARQSLETWLLSRFQQREPRWLIPPVLWRAGLAKLSFVQVLSVLAGLVAGAAIPLLPDFQIRGWAVSLSPLSGSSIGILLVLALDWCSVGLLIGTASISPIKSRFPLQKAVSAQLLAAVPVTLIVLSLVITTGMLQPWRMGTLNLSTVLAIQSGWVGLRWLALVQPLACVLWLICAAPWASDPRLHTSVAWQVHVLNRVLLTTALFAGGWQGPLADRCPVLGLLYTAAKGATITFVWTWLSASRPLPSLAFGSQTTWRLCTSLAGLNLLATALLAAANTPIPGMIRP